MKVHQVTKQERALESTRPMEGMYLALVGEFVI